MDRPGLFSLLCFALLLTRVEAAYAGRAYAAYGGIYIITSLLWLGLVERTRPLASDWLGAALCVAGRWSSCWGRASPELRRPVLSSNPDTDGGGKAHPGC